MLPSIQSPLFKFVYKCQLRELYAEASCELTRKSTLSPVEAARACKVYEPYIHDVQQQVDAAVTIFVMENKLRNLKGRDIFQYPPSHGTRIENPHQVRKTLESVDEEVVQILTTVRESNEKEKEEARVREQQARATRPS